MRTKTQDRYFLENSPMNLFEEFFFQVEWPYDRTSEGEITAEGKGKWCTYHLFAVWRQDLESLIISALIDMKIPQDKKETVGILLSLFNPKIWLGHFEIVPDEDIVSFRYNLVLRGNPIATLEQIEEIVTSAMIDCDRLYPALQFVLWGGKNPEEALLAAMLDTYGEA